MSPKFHSTGRCLGKWRHWVPAAGG